jgi:hypothetical protein
LSCKLVGWMVGMIVSIEYRILCEYESYEIQDEWIDNVDLDWNQHPKEKEKKRDY